LTNVLRVRKGNMLKRCDKRGRGRKYGCEIKSDIIAANEVKW